MDKLLSLSVLQYILVTIMVMLLYLFLSLFSYGKWRITGTQPYGGLSEALMRSVIIPVPWFY